MASPVRSRLRSVRADFLDFVGEHLAKIEPIETRAAMAWWEASTTGSGDAFRLHAALRAEIETILADPESCALLAAARNSGEILDPVEARLAEVLYLSHLARQTSPDLLAEIVAKATALERTFNTFRPALDGRPASSNDLWETLTGCDDSERCRRAWNASKEVGPELAAGIRELARLRNRAALDVGRPNHWALAMEVAELGVDRFDDLLDDLDRVTRRPYREAKREIDSRLAARFRLDPADLGPWHYSDPFFQEIPAIDDVDLVAIYRDQSPISIASRFFASIGLPVDEVLRRSDVEERPGKSEHAFCVDVDRRGDVRVLLNARPGPRWTGATLHELGHAVYDLGIRRDLPFPLRKPAHPFVTEAVAMFFGRLAEDGSWLRAVGVASGREAETIEETLVRRRSARHLVFARWCQAFLRFERWLYLDPDSDLEGAWWDLVERFQEVRRPDGRSAPDWATKIHIVAAPVYYPNYVLGEVFAAQLERELLRALGVARVGGIVGRSDAGAWLNERLFANGAAERWEGIVERATGGPLDVAAFAGVCQLSF